MDSSRKSERNETISLETERFSLRSLDLSDAEREWGAWTADPETAGLLNSNPRTMSVAERRAYVAKFDGRMSHLLGIFDKANDDLVGIWSVYVDTRTREYLLNVLVGPRQARNQGALTDTRDLIYRHFFETLSLERARCTVVGHNSYMIGRLKRRAWVHEKTSRVPNSTGTAYTEINHFLLTKDAWRNLDGRSMTPEQ